MPPSPAMNETRNRKARFTRVPVTLRLAGLNSRFTGLLLLLFHRAILETWRQPASASFRHCQRECLRHQQSADAFPRFRYGIHANRQEPLGGRAVLRRYQDYLSPTPNALIAELESQRGRASDGEDDGHMRTIHIQVRPVFEARTRVGRRAKAAHLADAQRAHHSTSIGCAPANDFNVSRASAEPLQFVAQGEDAIQ